MEILFWTHFLAFCLGLFVAHQVHSLKARIHHMTRPKRYSRKSVKPSSTSVPRRRNTQRRNHPGK